jgi:hypothetical protein
LPESLGKASRSHTFPNGDFLVIASLRSAGTTILNLLQSSRCSGFLFIPSQPSSSSLLFPSAFFIVLSLSLTLIWSYLLCHVIRQLIFLEP